MQMKWKDTQQKYLKKKLYSLSSAHLTFPTHMKDVFMIKRLDILELISNTVRSMEYAVKAESDPSTIK